MQICPLFLKTDYTMVIYGLRSTKPKKFETKKASTSCHVPPPTSAFTSSYSCVDDSHHHAPRVLYAYTCPLRMTSWMTSSSTTPVWPRLTWKSNLVRTAYKKKKKLNKKKRKRESFDQVELELWLWPKVKIFKKGLFHLVFRVHSDFEIRFFIWSLEIV